MLPQLNRLSKKKEIDGVFKKGISVFDGILGLKVYINNLETIRLCVIVSAKVSKKAVERNLIKRRIKAIFCKFIKEKKMMKKDYIIITLPSAKKASFVDLKKSIVNLLKRTRNI